MDIEVTAKPNYSTNHDFTDIKIKLSKLTSVTSTFGIEILKVHEYFVLTLKLLFRDILETLIWEKNPFQKEFES